jgi:hypothetical protein
VESSYPIFVILTVWGPLFIDFVRLSRPVGVSPAYIPSIYTEHAGGDDQIVRDPVPRVEAPTDVSVRKGDMGIVAAGVIPGVSAGIPWSVLVGCVTLSDGDKCWVHPEQLVKKMMNPARTVHEINE